MSARGLAGVRPGRRCGGFFLLLALLVSALHPAGSPALARAPLAPLAAPEPPRLLEVFFPREGMGDLLAVGSPLISVRRDELERLVRQRHREEVALREAVAEYERDRRSRLPVPYLVGDVRLEAVLETGSRWVRLSGSTRVDVRSDRPRWIPFLRASQAVVQSARIDGAQAAVRRSGPHGLEVLLRDRGRRHVEWRVALPVTQEGFYDRMSFELPGSSRARLEADLPGADLVVGTTPNLPIERRPRGKGERTRIDAGIPGSVRFSLRWVKALPDDERPDPGRRQVEGEQAPEPRAVAPPTPLVLTTAYHVLDAAYATLEARLHLDVRVHRAPIRRLFLQVPEGVGVLEREGRPEPGRSFQIHDPGPLGRARRVTLEMAEPFLGRRLISLRHQIPREGNPFTSDVPLIVPEESRWHDGYVVLTRSANLEISGVAPTGGARRIRLADLVPPVRRTLLRLAPRPLSISRYSSLPAGVSFQGKRYPDASMVGALATRAQARSDVTRTGHVSGTITYWLRSSGRKTVTLRPGETILEDIRLDGKEAPRRDGDSGQVEILLPDAPGGKTVRLEVTCRQRLQEMLWQGRVGLRLPEIDLSVRDLQWTASLPKGFLYVTARGENGLQVLHRPPHRGDQALSREHHFHVAALPADAAPSVSIEYLASPLSLHPLLLLLLLGGFMGYLCQRLLLEGEGFVLAVLVTAMAVVLLHTYSPGLQGGQEAFVAGIGVYLALVLVTAVASRVLSWRGKSSGAATALLLAAALSSLSPAAVQAGGRSWNGSLASNRGARSSDIEKEEQRRQIDQLRQNLLKNRSQAGANAQQLGQGLYRAGGKTQGHAKPMPGRRSSRPPLPSSPPPPPPPLPPVLEAPAGETDAVYWSGQEGQQGGGRRSPRRRRRNVLQSVLDPRTALSVLPGDLREKVAVALRRGVPLSPADSRRLRDLLRKRPELVSSPERAALLLSPSLLTVPIHVPYEGAAASARADESALVSLQDFRDLMRPYQPDLLEALRERPESPLPTFQGVVGSPDPEDARRAIRTLNASYRVVLEGTLARIVASFLVESTGEGWSSWNLDVGEAIPGSVTVDGAPPDPDEVLVSVRGSRLDVRLAKEGRRQIEVTMTAPVRGSLREGHLDLGPSPSSIGQVRLTWPDSLPREADMGPSPVRSEVEEGRDVLTSWVVPGDRLRIAWRPRREPLEEVSTAAPSEEGPERFGVESVTLFEPENGRIDITHWARLSIGPRGLRSLAIQVPPEMTVLSLETPGDPRPLVLGPPGSGGEGQRTLRLPERVAGNRVIVLRGVRAGPSGGGGGQVGLACPAYPGADRHSGHLAWRPEPATEVRVAERRGIEGRDWKELPSFARIARPSSLAKVHSFARPGYRLSLSVRRLERADTAVLEATSAWARTVLTAGGLAVTQIEYRIRNTREQFLDLSFPAGARLEMVQIGQRTVVPAKLPDHRYMIPLEPASAQGGVVPEVPVGIVYSLPSEALTEWGTWKGHLPGVGVTVNDYRWIVELPEDFPFLAVGGSAEEGEPSGRVPAPVTHGHSRSSSPNRRVFNQRLVSPGLEGPSVELSYGHRSVLAAAGTTLSFLAALLPLLLLRALRRVPSRYASVLAGAVLILGVTWMEGQRLGGSDAAAHGLGLGTLLAAIYALFWPVRRWRRRRRESVPKPSGEPPDPRTPPEGPESPAAALVAGLLLLLTVPTAAQAQGAEAAAATPLSAEDLVARLRAQAQGAEAAPATSPVALTGETTGITGLEGGIKTLKQRLGLGPDRVLLTVPYEEDHLREALGPAGRGHVLVSPSLMKRFEASREPPAPSREAPRPPLGYTLGAGLLRGEISGETGRFELTVELHLAGGERQSVRLLRGDLAVTGYKGPGRLETSGVDPVPEAEMKQGLVILDNMAEKARPIPIVDQRLEYRAEVPGKPGRHQLVLEFVQRRPFEFELPPMESCRARVVFDRPGVDADIVPGVKIRREGRADETVLVADLRPGGSVRISGYEVAPSMLARPAGPRPGTPGSPRSRRRAAPRSGPPLLEGASPDLGGLGEDFAEDRGGDRGEDRGGDRGDDRGEDRGDDLGGDLDDAPLRGGPAAVPLPPPAPAREPAAAEPLPWMAARLSTNLSFGESHVKGFTLVQIEMKRAAPPQIELRVPTTYRVHRLTGSDGGEIRLPRPGPEIDGMLPYVLPAPIRWKGVEHRLTVFFEKSLSGDEDELPLPLLSVAGAAFESGFVTLEREGSLEIQVVRAEGLEEVPPHLLPFPTSARTARAYRFGGMTPDLAVTLTRYEDARMATVALDGVHVDTEVTAKGDSLTRVEYRLRRSSGQYLSVLLPSGASYLKASLRGRSLEVSREKDGRLLLPLNGGDESPLGSVLQLALVYRGPKFELGSRGVFRLPLPSTETAVTGDGLRFTVRPPPGFRFDAPAATRATVPSRRLLGLLHWRSARTAEGRLGLVPPGARLEIPIRYSQGAWIWLGRLGVFLAGVVLGLGAMRVFLGGPGLAGPLVGFLTCAAALGSTILLEEQTPGNGGAFLLAVATGVGLFALLASRKALLALRRRREQRADAKEAVS